MFVINKNLFSIISKLIKFRISILILLTTYLGYYLGLRSINELMLSSESWIKFSFLCVGTFLCSSAAAMLNQYLERVEDSMMDRTKERPLPLKQITAKSVKQGAFLLWTLGTIILIYFINFNTALISFITVASYAFIYTPLKKKTPWNTLVGSIPGALPPLGGWVAATGKTDFIGIVLFMLLYCWQIPHFLSLAIIYSDDYKRGGFKMFPLYKNLNITKYLILIFSIAMVVTSVSLYLLKVSGIVYVVGAGLLGMVFVSYSILIFINKSSKNVRMLFFISILYFPIILFLLIIG